MTKISAISDNKTYTAINLGSLDGLADHSLIHAVSGQEVKGKVFLKEATKATGTEISLQTLAPPYRVAIFPYP
ncbi:MAG: hypothetical protein LBG19_08730 [Prevotellaceae bacterium]|jgi:ribosomal protein S5|nr:hypothetical protein [Prevotellaceae bacterium]